MPSELDAFLSGLYSDDPFADVRAASDAHRADHAAVLPGGEQECGVFPSNALKLRLIDTLVRATVARRVLEIGGGLGYSALWLAQAAGLDGRVETIDRFPEHVAQIAGFAQHHGLADRISAIHGEGDAVLASLTGPYDLIHDDGWFGVQPAYYDRMIDVLRPGGLLVMSNWFLLDQGFRETPDLDWSQFAGPSWRADVRAYAKVLVEDPRLDVSFVMGPAHVALAHKR
jgi:predicted O-methyltransferase YrrM